MDNDQALQSTRVQMRARFKIRTLFKNLILHLKVSVEEVLDWEMRKTGFEVLDPRTTIKKYRRRGNWCDGLYRGNLVSALFHLYKGFN